MLPSHDSKTPAERAAFRRATDAPDPVPGRTG